MTAALALYQHLGLPAPWNPVPKGKRVPILVYGGASAVGAFALKFAKLSNLGPIITIAGSGADFVTSLNAADYIVDYRKNNVVEDVKKILDEENVKLYHAFDAISNNTSWKHVVDILGKDGPQPGKILMVDPPETMPQWPKGIEFGRVFVSSAYGQAHNYCDAEKAKVHRDFAYAFYRFVIRITGDSFNTDVIGSAQIHVTPAGRRQIHATSLRDPATWSHSSWKGGTGAIRQDSLFQEACVQGGRHAWIGKIPMRHLVRNNFE